MIASEGGHRAFGVPLLSPPPIRDRIKVRDLMLRARKTALAVSDLLYARRTLFIPDGPEILSCLGLRSIVSYVHLE